VFLRDLVHEADATLVQLVQALSTALKKVQIIKPRVHRAELSGRACTHGQLLVSAVGVRALDDLDDVQGVRALVHRVVPPEALQVPHVPLAERLRQHHLRTRGTGRMLDRYTTQ
jgi:hypothetical protein